MTSFLHDTVVLHFVIKTVQGKTDCCHRLRGFCFFFSFNIPRISLVTSVSLYVLFLCASKRGSSCVFRQSRVLFDSIGISLSESEHNMDGSTTASGGPEVDKWLCKGFRLCGKSAVMTPAEAKCQHGGHNVPGSATIRFPKQLSL